ncbi:MAG: biopolymer transport protein ExbB [Oleiphilaceae bacterium]|jgi:biopolymer transport protein ExbB
MWGLFPSQSALLDYYEMGGFVMLPLIFVAVVLWYALAYRALNIRSSQYNPRDLIRRAKKDKKKFKRLKSTTALAAKFAVTQSKKIESRNQLKVVIDQEFEKLKQGLTDYKTLVRSLVAIAPLLGLLGTVDGMIETFNSLGDMALFSQTGGIAGGISKALFTTQMGLAISIPGLLLGRIIERKEMNVRRELDQIRDLVCAMAAIRSKGASA